MTDEGEASIVILKGVIKLTEKECMIFNRLKEAVNHNKLDTELRVAGGWVRDKLLGTDCNDIDIAIDNMVGKELCAIFKAYLLEQGEEVKGDCVIPSNSAKSKHLETARMYLYGYWIDFVNLRSETYSKKSRIPTKMSFGEPKDDADRRDLTINSLFYNMKTDCVEDYTRRGITDLKLGKIVTPLPPKETFLDDPLRVLRAIRFGARFSFTLDQGLKEAAGSDEVRASIDEMISRERIGHEVDLMMGGNQPVKAVTYIYDLKLFWIVFDRPSVIETNLTPEACDSRHCLAFIDAAWSLIQSLEEAVSLSDDQRRLCLYSALFLPLRNMKYKYNNKKQRYVVHHIFLNSLKLKSKDSDKVIMIHRAAEKFTHITSRLTSQENGHCSKLRILTGLLMREIKDFWQVALLVSTLVQYPNGEKSRELFMLVKDMITKQGLENIWETKPLFHGHEIKSILKLNGTCCIGEWQQKVVEWQLANPSGTANECQIWMREQWQRLNNVK
ncbi:CCA tRNA nucleotidyltransferase, mitochondrial-like [Silene latifolia]|uniref:CCA tRNA nucleotidyltransferase, mitochondrial-like n=1 Tax=Silene latifolia TaxID=37657 RepID=UPI003D783DED